MVRESPEGWSGTAFTSAGGLPFPGLDQSRPQLVGKAVCDPEADTELVGCVIHPAADRCSGSRATTRRAGRKSKRECRPEHSDGASIEPLRLEAWVRTELSGRAGLRLRE